jgi:hypothetical protein
MSLFESASLVVTPNGAKASKLYAIKPTDGSGDLSVTRATTARRFNSAGLVESVANNVPRLDYLNSTCPSILVEPQRTNVQTYSEDFSNAVYIKVGSTVTSNATVAPDGNTTADKLVEDTSTGLHTAVILGQQITLADYTVSVFVKADGRTKFQLAEGFSVGGNVIFDLTAVTATNTAPAKNGRIEAYPNGWYKCSATWPNLTGVNTQILLNLLNDAGASSYAGNGTSGVFLWGSQIELSSHSTSYIPTTTAAVTRNADVINKTSVSSLIGQTEGTLYTEVKVNKLIGTASRYIFHVSDGTTNNRIYIAFSGSSSNVLRARIFNGGTLQCSIDTSAITTTGTYKLALAYKNNDIVFYVNGVQIGTDTSATIPTCSRVDIGQNYAGASQFSDNVSLSTLFKTRLTNDVLSTLTTL